MIERTYGVGTGADVRMQHEVAASSSLATSADWTPVAGDVTVSKDGATAANIATLPVYDADSLDWLYVFSEAELQCEILSVAIRDAALKDDQFWIETTDHESAKHPRGVNKHLTTNTISATGFTAEDSVGDNGVMPVTALGARFIRGVAVVISSSIASDVDCSCLITNYSETGTTGTFTGLWNRVPTGTATTLQLNIYSAAVGWANVGAVNDNAGAAAVLKLFADILDQATGQLDLGSLAAEVLARLLAAVSVTKLDLFAAILDPATGQLDEGSIAEPLKANVKEINDVTIDGAGTSGDPWGPA